MSRYEMQRGQLWSVEGEIYELVDFRVTKASTPQGFLTTAFFKSKDPNSENPRFEERVETVLSEEHVYKRHLRTLTREELEHREKEVVQDELAKIRRNGDRANLMGLEEWLETVPKPSGRLYNILRRLCLKEFNGLGRDISPFKIRKEAFLELSRAGQKSWEDFEALRNIEC
ncbi:MAG: hypothetical protein AAF717_21325 [Bacteroidota bacterium]|nr:hypothetical protein [uncultured Allomuricauda sp.]